MKPIASRVARLVAACFAVPLLLGTGACKKGEEKSGEASSNAAAATTAGCTDKAYKHTNPSFCVDLPAGYAAGADTKKAAGTQVRFKKSDSEWIDVTWGRYANLAKAIEQIKIPDGEDKIVEQSALPNGGYYMLSADSTGEKYVHVVINGSKGFVDCFAGSSKADDLAVKTKTCKSIHVD